MKTFTAVLLCSCLAWADPPADAPVADTEVSVKLKKGDPMPFDGRAVTEAENHRRGAEHADMRGELEKAHQSWLMPKPLFIVIVVGAAVLSAGVAAGVTYVAVQK